MDPKVQKFVGSFFFVFDRIFLGPNTWVGILGVDRRLALMSVPSGRDVKVGKGQT